MQNISDILREATNGQVDEVVLTDIENAFNSRLQEKAKLHVDKALLEQDELYSAKLEQLLEAIDTDHSAKLEKVVKAIDKDRVAKLKAVVTKYENTLNEDAEVFKADLVESISEYLDAFLEESVPTAEIKEAVKNKKAITVLEGLRKHLAVDSALEKKSIKDAVSDGKNQINEATVRLESALQEKDAVIEELNSIKSNLLIEQKTSRLDERTSKFVKKMLNGKSYDYIAENFDYTLKLFGKKEESRLESLKTEALKDTSKSDVLQEQVVVESAAAASPYMSELSKY
jgi:hypothetical protein|tara:strand:- start:684 stop:1541 length:858 start_codon:yes stop_codon:yes gene_type:complete